MAIVINENDGFIQHVATGGETSFTFDYPIFDETHIKVLKTDGSTGAITTLTITTDYTVPAGSVDNQSGGQIDLTAGSFPSGATATDKFTLLLNPPFARTTDFNQAGDFLAATLNEELDLLAQQFQRLNRDATKAVLLPQDSTLTSVEIDEPTGNGGKLVAVNSGGTALEYVTVASVSGTLDTTITAAAAGDILMHNGSSWIDATTLTGDYTFSGDNTFSKAIALTETTAPTTAASEGAIYTKDTSGQPELFFREESSGDEVQITSAGSLNVTAGGLVLLGTATASSSTSIDIGSGLDIDVAIDNTYDRYLITYDEIVPGTDAVAFYLRLGNGGAFDSGASDYGWIGINMTGSTTVNGAYDAADAQIPLFVANAVGGAAGESASGHAWIHAPSDTATNTLVTYEATFISNAGVMSMGRGHGSRLEAAAHDRARLLMSTGNIASGEVKLYGVLKS